MTFILGTNVPGSLVDGQRSSQGQKKEAYILKRRTLDECSTPRLTTIHVFIYQSFHFDKLKLKFYRLIRYERFTK